MSGANDFDADSLRASCNIAVVLQTHYIDRALVKLFRKLAATCVGRYRAMLLLHVPPGTPKPALIAGLPHHFVTTSEIRISAYGRKSGINSEWHIWKGGNTDLSALHLFRTLPKFDHYWFIEYDVRFTGDWNAFFQAFEASSADLLTTSLRRLTVQPNWMHWATLQLPPPSDPTMAIPTSLAERDRICAFMPIFRVSRSAMEMMDRAYRDGWSGHCEVTWPTVINHFKLQVEDIGGDGEFVAPGNRNRFYTNTLDNADLSPGSMAFRPARSWPGLQRNQLWHPVKPLMFKLSADARSMTPGWFINLLKKLSVRPMRMCCGGEEEGPRQDEHLRSRLASARKSPGALEQATW